MLMIQPTVNLGFNQITIINKKTQSTIAYTKPEDVAREFAVNDRKGITTKETMNIIDNISRKYMKDQFVSEIVDIIKDKYRKLYFENEIQQLLDDWKDVNKTNFCFHGRTYKIIQREKDGKYIACKTDGSPTYFCIACHFSSNFEKRLKKGRVFIESPLL